VVVIAVLAPALILLLPYPHYLNGCILIKELGWWWGSSTSMNIDYCRIKLIQIGIKRDIKGW